MKADIHNEILFLGMRKQYQIKHVMM